MCVRTSNLTFGEGDETEIRLIKHGLTYIEELVNNKTSLSYWIIWRLAGSTEKSAYKIVRKVCGGRILKINT